MSKKTPSQTNKYAKSGYDGLRDLGATVSPAVKRTLKGGKQRELLGTLYMKWGRVVSAKYAKYCKPSKIRYHRGDSGATLSLSADSSRALELAMDQEQIIARVNAYLGYQAITRIIILHDGECFTPMPKPQAVTEDSYKPSTALDDVADETLKTLLSRMGQSIYRQNRNQSKDP